MLPIVIMAIAYTLGIIGGLYKICIVPFCLCICFILVKKDWKTRLIVMSVFLLGILYTSLRVNFYDKKYEAGKVSMEVKIVSDAIPKEKVNSYIVKNARQNKFILYVSKDVNLAYGMKISVTGNLEIPDVSRNRRWF
ncbi:MAG: hypothetical protein IJ217_05505 [Clostridia bacterium]|nr:hypothetical protein [Clostridia bacterium]